LPSIHVSWIVALQEFRPARGIGWMIDRDRCYNRNSDRIRYFIAFPESSVFSVDRERGDCPDYGSKDNTSNSVRDQSL